MPFKAETLPNSPESMEALIAAIPDGSLVVNEEGIITLVNSEAESLFGYCRDEMIGQPIEMLLPAQVQKNHARQREHFFSAPSARPMCSGLDLFGRRKDGTMFRVEISLNAFEAVKGKAALAIVRDVSKQKQLEHDLRQAKGDAEEANLAKSEFLSRVSHELRTPLNVVLGFAQVIQMDDLSPRQRESVELILKAGQHLLLLINEVLDIARAEAGTLLISLEPVEVQLVIGEAMSLMHPMAQDAGVTLLDESAMCPGTFIQADRQRLLQVLLNLISNAIRYNETGGNVRVTCSDARDGWVKITVADTGCGVSPEVRDRLFTPFDRLGAETRGVEGIGLGLALSMKLMHAMKGLLSAAWDQPKGSTFTIELPEATTAMVGIEERVALERVGSTPLAREHYRVVYIEDNLENLRLMEVVFADEEGVELMPALQGRVGLDLVRLHQPDLVLLDVNLPDMSGLDVLIQLKADPVLQRIPVIVISADATRTTSKRLLDAGALKYMTKPIDVGDLIGSVRSALSGQVN